MVIEFGFILILGVIIFLMKIFLIVFDDWVVGEGLGIGVWLGVGGGVGEFDVVGIGGGGEVGVCGMGRF